MAKTPKPAWVKPAALGGILLLFLILIGSRLGPLPPAGHFFNPFLGFWRNAEAGGLKGGQLRLDGLREPVTISFDKRGVPHIFAQNAHDLFFAQGYVTARDRLWQMEVQTHAAAGRLAEILGRGFLEEDRFQRRLGILRAAERAVELMEKHPETREAAEAYAAGVNAHIGSLNPARLPLEYKLLGYAPERWTPLKTALLIKNMQWTLSGNGKDLSMTNTLGKFGSAFMERFYPVLDSTLEPVIPEGTAWTRPPDTVPAPPPAPLLLPGPPGDSLLPDTAAAPVQVLPRTPDPGNGSNNFVVSGRRSRTGFPILATDPHLDLGLPSIWYEVQLVAPGVNVYGFSLAGAPAIVIGFNRSIAWGLTNGNDDVFDWYRLEFKDSTMSEYLYGGNWRPTRQVVEAIRIRGGGTVLDTVYYTHHGPIVLKTQETPRNPNTPSEHALRWLALDPSDELAAFLGMMKAENHAAFAAALEPYHSPAQNFAFASNQGEIAMDHHGLFPRKWKGQGRYTLLGSEPAHDWQGWVPRDENPASVNPAQGWLASANQPPTDSTYPHFLGSSWFLGRRSARLDALVSAADTLTPEGAAAILLDDYDLHAALVLPDLMKRINRATLSPADSAAAASLDAWDFRCRPDLKAPALFDQWWRILYRSIWQDEFSSDSVRYQWPSKDRTRRLILEESGEDWFDDVTTPNRETLNFLVNRTFRDACARHRNPGGKLPAGPGLSWSEYRPVHIRHLARIPALSRMNLAAGGCGDCVNALRTFHGPSLRMVVALGRPGPAAYAIYPGGQSGNPGSRRYDEFVDDWAAGRMYTLEYFKNPGDRPEAVAARLFLEGK